MLNFGRKKTKKQEKELFPDIMVLTLLPVDTEKKKGGKRLKFNSKAIDELKLLNVGSDGVLRNHSVSFIDEIYEGHSIVWLFIPTDDLKYFDYNDNRWKTPKCNSMRVTKGDHAVASEIWYDAIVKLYGIKDTTKPNYFSLTRIDRPDELNVPLYRLDLINYENNAETIIKDANHEMQELNLIIH